MQACAAIRYATTPCSTQLYSCRSVRNSIISYPLLVLGWGPPPTPPSRINPPPSPSMRDSGTLKVSLSGLGGGPEAATATRLPIHLTMRCSSPADLTDLSRHASRRIAYSGLDWISQTRHSQRPQPGCRRPSIH